jgi:3-phosphoshikimate 1-carboxyvinyltransferase
MKQISFKSINGILSAPSSKSMMQRYVALACLSDQTTKILNPTFCDDGVASIEIAKSLGAKVLIKDKFLSITPSKNIPDNITLNCAESGTSFRLFSAIAALYNQPIKLTGTGTLLKRPMKMVEQTLLSCNVSVISNSGFAPLTITGPINSSSINLDGSESSQLLSGLIIASTVCPNNTHIKVNNLKSKPYVIMTLKACHDFGIKVEASDALDEFIIHAKQTPRANEVTVEGDWSGASFLLVAAAIAGNITVTNLLTNSTQADIKILSALKDFGADVELTSNAVTVRKNKNLSFEFDATDCPDLFPPLVSLAAAASATCRIKGASRLVHKESNRALALIQEYNKIGVKVSQQDDYLLVNPGNLTGGVVDSHDDHRIAMSLAITALRSKSVITIKGSQSVRKSYPNFFEDLESIYE